MINQFLTAKQAKEFASQCSEVDNLLPAAMQQICKAVGMGHRSCEYAFEGQSVLSDRLKGLGYKVLETVGPNKKYGNRIFTRLVIKW